MSLPPEGRRRMVHAAAWAAAAATTAASFWVLTVVEPVAQSAPTWVSEARRLETAGLGASRLGSSRVRALVTVVDPSFFRHHGIAVGSAGPQRTTITQDLAERYALEPYAPGFVAGIRRSIAALVIDRHLSKEQQLTLYLDTVDLGAVGDARIEGFPAAARAYYGKELADLSDDEYLALVAMVLAPSDYDPRAHPDALAERVRRIRRLLAGACAPGGTGDVLLKRCALP